MPDPGEPGPIILREQHDMRNGVPQYPWDDTVPAPAYIDGDPIMSAVKVPPLPGDTGRVHRWVCIAEDLRNRHGGGLDLIWVAFERTYRTYATEFAVGSPFAAYVRLADIADRAWVEYDPAAARKP